jgi:hypothetical protein
MNSEQICNHYMIVSKKVSMQIEVAKTWGAPEDHVQRLEWELRKALLLARFWSGI